LAGIVGGVELGELGLAGGDVEGELVVEVEGLLVELVEGLDVLQERVLVGQELAGDAVDLALDLLVAGHELLHGLGAADQALPERGLAVGVELAHREAADRADEGAQAVAGGADVLVANALRACLG
jgi:hypothetical protein